MKAWVKHPVIHEINAWVWLNDLSRKYGRAVDFSSVPAEEWARIAAGGFDAVWFMGVWERSPAGIAIAQRNAGLQDDFRRALPDFVPEDNVGSPYCVRRYVVDPHLGGTEGLAEARAALRERGMRLILDFVPNHVAPDHPWVGEHPEYFVHGSVADLGYDPASFIESGGKVFACGRDPYFPAWPDVLQLNAFSPELRREAIATISAITEQCDGVRCDMAMLMLNSIFERTWGARAGAKPDEDYWQAIIPAVKAGQPDFKFIAEAYWDLEWELQQQGFDYCYDKKLYDRLEYSSAESVRLHLLADDAYQQKMLRFIENHDEPRAAKAFPEAKGRAAAVAMLTLPGGKLLHEGQFEGFKVRLPVFLGRRPGEAVDQELAAFYAHLLNAVNREALRNGEWRLCERSGWSDNQSCLGLLAWCWKYGDERYLAAINYQSQSVQARIHQPWAGLKGRVWRLTDLLSDAIYDRSGDEMQELGLYVAMGAWKYHLFQLHPL